LAATTANSRLATEDVETVVDVTREDDAGTSTDETAEMADTPLPASLTATFTIKPPDSFDFFKTHECEKWIRRFECFRLASKLNESSDANQVKTLVYCMGDEADLTSMRL